MVNFDELNGSLRSRGELASADRRGNNSSKVIRDISPITIPSIVQIGVRLLEAMGAGGRNCGCGIVGVVFCLRRLFLPFDFLDIARSLKRISRKS
jgi:hypothetical protein